MKNQGVGGQVDSYSALERRFLGPARQALLWAYAPLLRLLAALRVTTNMVSVAQVALGGIFVFIVADWPRLALGLFMAALVLDGMDGALARHTGQASRFGELLNQYCDHTREVLAIAGLALTGALNPFLATMYGLTYPAFNLTLYLCNYYGTSLPVAIKSYLVVYPALIAYLWFGHNWLTPAVALSVTLMGLVMVQGLWYLRRVFHP